MRVDLKSDSYYDFNTVRYVKIIDGEKIEIEGNFEKGKKYHKVEILKRMIDETSYKKLVRYMKGFMQRFDFEGCCPYCENTKIFKIQKCKQKVSVNNPKQKNIVYDEEDIDYLCGWCHKRFPVERIKIVDIVMYYR